MKKTSKTLFSLLLVLTMVFQFAAVAPTAWADGASVSIYVQAPVDDEGQLSSNIYSLEGEVKDPGVVKAMADLSDTGALAADGVVLMPPAGFAVIQLGIVPSGSDKSYVDVSSEFASFTEDEDDHAAIVISKDFFTDKFTDESTAYTLYVRLAPVNSIAPKIATCGTDGYKEYHLLASTGELYLDAEIPVIPATGEHTLEHVDAVAATPEKDGNIEYWQCSVCEELFSDAEGKTAIKAEDVVVKYQAPAPATFTVSFDANGHGTAPEALTVNSGEKAEEPTAPTAEGFTFGGWFTDATCENAYSFDTAVTADVTLYAKWTENPPAPATYTLSFDANGGTGTMDAITVTAGEEYTVPACGFTAPEGKEFSHWLRGDLPLRPGAKDTLTSDNALVAEWKDASSSSETPSDTHTHSLKKIEAKAATSVDDGNIEYWVCEDETCGKYFSDAEGKTEITDKTSIIVKATGKPMTEGTDTEWNQDSKDGLKIHIDAAFDATLQDTLVVKIGDTVVPKDKYTVTEGSVNITIDPVYLATLPTGTHTVSITFPSGNTVSSTVTIHAAAPGVTTLALTYDPAGFVKLYDGKEFDLESLKNYITVVNLPAGYKADLLIAYMDTTLPYFRDAGSTPLQITIVGVKDSADNDVSSLFTAVPLQGVPITIAPRRLTVETRDDSKVYDGVAWSYTHMSNAQPIMTYTDPKLGEYVRDGKTYVQTISIKYTASPKNMGTYENKAELIIREKEKGSSGVGEDVTKNYDITYKYGKIKITDSKGNVPANSGVKTGDENNIWLWVGLMAAAVILVVVLLVVTRKSRKDGKAPSSGVSE